MLTSRSGRRFLCASKTSAICRNVKCISFESAGNRGPENGNGRRATHSRGAWGLKRVEKSGEKRPSDRDTRECQHEQHGEIVAKAVDSHNVEPAPKKPSLMEQLFPEESKRGQAQETDVRDGPYIPLDELPTSSQRSDSPVRYTDPNEGSGWKSPGAWRTHNARMRAFAADGERASVLVLRNASTSLTEEDFRRAAPQGQHIEGWSLEQSTFVKIIPGRDLATLEQQNFYYLIFSTQMAAYLYQGHVNNLARLARKYMPSSVTSPPAPPPGYQLNDGTDLYAALQSYGLTPPSQPLSLRQLQEPLSPLVASLVRNKGYSSLVRRPDRSPFEVRLTLDGPQLPLGTIQFILHETALARSLNWSGGAERVPRMTLWTPSFAPSPTRKDDSDAVNWGNRDMAWTEDEQIEADVRRQQSATSMSDGISVGAEDAGPLKRRVPKRIWVVGFHTEAAAQMFIRYWHRRPMKWESEGAVAGIENAGGDIPAIANAEMLW